jgi:hypothetical protein
MLGENVVAVQIEKGNRNAAGQRKDGKFGFKTSNVNGMHFHNNAPLFDLNCVRKSA